MGGAKKCGLRVAVVLGVETSGIPPLETDLRGETSPQVPAIPDPLGHLAQEHAGPVP
jgi:hypothetical protein